MCCQQRGWKQLEQSVERRVRGLDDVRCELSVSAGPEQAVEVWNAGAAQPNQNGCEALHDMYAEDVHSAVGVQLASDCLPAHIARQPRIELAGRPLHHADINVPSRSCSQRQTPTDSSSLRVAE